MDDDVNLYGSPPQNHEAATGRASKRQRLSSEDPGNLIKPESASPGAEDPTPPLESHWTNVSNTAIKVPPNTSIPGLFLADEPRIKVEEDDALEPVALSGSLSVDPAVGANDVDTKVHNHSTPPRPLNDGAFRNEAEYQEQGRANIGNPDAEWQLDSSEEDNDSTETSRNGTDSNDDSCSGSLHSGDEEEEEEEDGEDAVFLDIQREARRLMDVDEGSDDEGPQQKRASKGPLRTKNELPEPESAADGTSLEISSSTPIVSLGTIETVVDSLILIRASVSAEYQVLDEKSLLCFEDRSILGSVRETFGRVEQPYYTVQLGNSLDANAMGVKEGRKVYYIPSYSSFLFTKSIKALKGSDASNLHDEEVGDDEREFSDDEAEAEHKRKRKSERKSRLATTSNHPEDEGDEPYVPLSRPPNLHNMMPPVPQQSHHQVRESRVSGQSREDYAPRSLKSKWRGRGHHGQFGANNRHMNQRNSSARPPPPESMATQMSETQLLSISDNPTTSIPPHEYNSAAPLPSGVSPLQQGHVGGLHMLNPYMTLPVQFPQHGGNVITMQDIINVLQSNGNWASGPT